jgi:hypothetical protein
MEGGIERSLLDDEDFFRNLANALGDAVAVDGAESDDFEDEHVEGALQQVSAIDGSHKCLSMTFYILCSR